jgi:hypothetical protein
MTWTYSGDPTLSTRDQVRFLIGDTNSSTPIFQDEEIDWLLTQNTNVYLAAASAADAAASGVVAVGGNSATKTKTVGALSISYGDTEKAKDWRTLASQLRVRAALTRTIVPYSGGISKSDKATRQQDSDWNKPSFARGMHDYPGADLKPYENASTLST